MKQNFSNEIFEKFQQFLIKRSGLYFSSDKKSSLCEKILSRMKTSDHNDFDHYLNFISLDDEKGKKERSLFIESLTIGETYFFRNTPHFEVLRGHVIPEILSKKKEKQLKIWCAGCSTGEEPYSVAILLREMIPDFSEWNLSILATDINRDSLKRAEEGIYTERSISYAPSHIQDQYFVQKKNRYALDKRVKKMVSFRKHNLIEDSFALPEMQEVDILFCRNVTIYFNLETLKQLMKRFASCLSEEGYFFIGHSETLWNISKEFSPVEFPNTFIYQKDAGIKKEAVSSLPIVIPTSEQVEKSKPQVPISSEAEIEKKADPDPSENLMGRATDLANQESYEEALVLLKKILIKDNLNVQAYCLSGILCVKLGQFSEAVQKFKQLLYVDPELLIGYFHLANVYLQLGECALAKKEYQNGIKLAAQMEEESEVSFSEGMSVGVLKQALARGLETASGGLQNGRV